MISIDQIKQLRQETSVAINECKKALEESGGDLEKAKEILRKKGQELAQKRAKAIVKEGVVASYIHSNQKIGVLVEVRCETDFVARSKEFKTLCHDLALHIAGMHPSFIKPEDIPEEFLRGEKEIYQEQFSKTGKPEKLIKEMVGAKLQKYEEEICLLTQSFVKNPDKTVQDVINEYISRLGENIIVERFARYEI